MKNKDIAAWLDGFDPEAEVAIRLSVPEGAFDDGTEVSEVDGEYLFISDERNLIGMENGRITIIGDMQP